jgi:hypothetical protein
MFRTSITLTDKRLLEADDLAQQTFEKFKNQNGYYNNTANSHLKGRLGEMAVEQLCEELSLDFESVFRDLSRDKECDLVVNSLKIEVKTWSTSYWDDMGRCIAVGQLGTLQKKANYIIWCTTNYSGDGVAVVEIQGWNFVSEIEDAPVRWTGPVQGRQVKNHQFDQGDLRRMDELIKGLADA